MEPTSDGRKAELRFQEWLDKNKIAYVSINQGYDSFAQIFKGCISRPDYLVAVNYVGLIAFEVKEYSSKKWGNFSINKTNNNKIMQF